MSGELSKTLTQGGIGRFRISLLSSYDSISPKHPAAEKLRDLLGSVHSLFSKADLKSKTVNQLIETATGEARNLFPGEARFQYYAGYAVAAAFFNAMKYDAPTHYDIYDNIELVALEKKNEASNLLLKQKSGVLETAPSDISGSIIDSIFSRVKRDLATQPKHVVFPEQDILEKRELTPPQARYFWNVMDLVSTQYEDESEFKEQMIEARVALHGLEYAPSLSKLREQYDKYLLSKPDRPHVSVVNATIASITYAFYRTLTDCNGLEGKYLETCNARLVAAEEARAGSVLEHEVTDHGEKFLSQDGMERISAVEQLIRARNKKAGLVPPEPGSRSAA